MEQNSVYRSKIEKQLTRLEQLFNQEPFGKEFQAWNTQTKMLLQNVFGAQSPEAIEFCVTEYNSAATDRQKDYEELLKHKRILLEKLLGIVR